jgi:acetyltransferase-like isoleucine patch superfamily enzyme
MKGTTEPLVAPPSQVPPQLRGAPPPRQGGLLALLRFMHRQRMLNLNYARLLVRLAAWKLRLRSRLRLDGLAFIGPGCKLEVGKDAVLELGRWSWIGHGCKIRCHEGVVSIGAKTVLGQECTISAYQHISIGHECVVADRVMLIDFDHGMVEVDRPIRLQGIYKRDVHVGSNVWIGYAACILRGTIVGDNAVIGTNAVVTRNVPANAVVGGVPARLIRMRKPPRRMRYR